MSPLISVLIVVALFVIPFSLGAYFANRLRMPDYSWKIGLILWTIFCSTVILVLYWPPKLGIDLSGGMILIYEVDQTQKKPGVTVDMDKLITAVARRINPVGIKEITLRKYGQEQVQIVIPDVSEAAADRVADLVSRVGTLEFRILANMHDNKALIQRALSDSSINVILDSEGNREAWWVPIMPGQESDPGLNVPDIAKRTKTLGKKKITQVLVIQDNYNVTGDFLDHASQGTDPNGRPDVDFVFNTQGGKLFGMLTNDNKPDEVTGYQRKLGIILDGEMFSAPGIKSPIYDRGFIEGSFTPQQIEQQVDVLNAGALPATLTKQPISRLYSGPTLGSDTIRKSTMALVYASILVPLFMLWYYRFCGVIADLVLVLNIALLLAIMITIKATFTLSGFAGLALTVGMAVDNNVLVFERLREELARGAALRMAIRNAFNRASATIIDCNITHLIAAIVLYMIGNEQIKGFALTLLLGVSISMFTSVFVARVLFDIAEKHRWITKLNMRHIVGHTNIDFMGMFPYCATFSIIITVMGLGVAVWRGVGLFDIDFTGGVSVQTLFNQPQHIADIRNKLEKMPGTFPDVTISEVRFGDEESNLRYEVNTSNANVDEVKDELKKLFPGQLVTNQLTVKNSTLIKSGQAEKEVPKTEPGSPDIKPADTAPETPATPAKPADTKDNNKQSSRIIKRSGLMAAVLAVPFIFGQVDAAPAAQPTNTAQPAAMAPAQTTPPAQQPQAQITIPNSNPNPQTSLPEISNPFVGGTQSELDFSQKIDHQLVEDLVKKAMDDLKFNEKEIQLDVRNDDYVEGSKTAYNNWTVKIGLPPEKAEAVFDHIKSTLGQSPFFPASNAIGGAVAVSARYQAFYALVASWLLIILYLWIRFQGVAFGVAAVLSLIHDVLVALGAIAFSLYLAPYFGWLYIDPFKINLTIIAAFLTIIGYSVNDTIVVFDRIREVRGKDPNMTAKMINDSTNQTLSRTLLTSLTVFIVVVVLYFFGGQALRGFSFALLVGVITGTYSSIYVAAPTLLWLIGSKKSS